MSKINDLDLILSNLNSIKKVAYSGTHGTGKTTSVFNLATQCKLHCTDKSIHVLTELASESPYKINRETTTESQLWIYSNQLKTELEISLKYDIIITDRSIADCIAYSFFNGFTELAKAKLELAKQYINTYDFIFLKTTEYNSYLYSDGIRDGVNLDFRNGVEQQMIKVYDVLKPYMKYKNTLNFI